MPDAGGNLGLTFGERTDRGGNTHHEQLEVNLTRYPDDPGFAAGEPTR